MRQRLFTILLLVASVLELCQPAAAMDRLEAEEIAATLTGNTIFGEWRGDPYAQYFDPDGTTIFQFKGGRRFEGDWHVDPETDRYCSYHWYRGTKCYELYRDGEALLWREEDQDKLLTSTLVSGRKLYED